MRDYEKIKYIVSVMLLITLFYKNVSDAWELEDVSMNNNDEFVIFRESIYEPERCVTYINYAAAFDGENYFVVWDAYGHDGSQDIYGRIISKNGKVEDGNIVITSAINIQCNPKISFDGTNYFVVWEDYRNDTDYDIYGTFVSKSGKVLNHQGIAIVTEGNNQWSPVVVFTNNKYFVIWEDWRHNYSSHIYGTRVSITGEVLDKKGILISNAMYDQCNPSIYFDGTNCLAVWEEWRDNFESNICGVLFPPDGKIMKQSEILISATKGKKYCPFVASDGTNYFVVWQNQRSGTDFDIYGARVAQNGTIFDPSGITISIAPHIQRLPSVVFDGTDYVVVWEDLRSGFSDIFGSRISSRADVIDTFELFTNTGKRFAPVLITDQKNQLFIIYSGYSDYINNHLASKLYIGGKFYPFLKVKDNSTVPRNRYLFSKFESHTFYSSILIRYCLAMPSNVSLKVYNIAGQCVRTIVNAKQDAGIHEINWDGKDENGLRLPQGIYILRLETDEYTGTKKIVLLH